MKPTTNETQILQLLSDGYAIKEIEDVLHCTIAEIKAVKLKSEKELLDKDAVLYLGMRFRTEEEKNAYKIDIEKKVTTDFKSGMSAGQLAKKYKLNQWLITNILQNAKK